MTMILQDVNLGNIIRSIRLSKGFTQEKVVTELQLLGSSLSRSSYSKIEMGIRNIKVTDLVLLKKVFKIGYSEFFNMFE